MATLKQKIECELRVRQMLAQADVPPPDHIEYGYCCIRAYWLETKTVLVVDIDDFPEDLAHLGFPSEFPQP